MQKAAFKITLSVNEQTYMEFIKLYKQTTKPTKSISAWVTQQMQEFMYPTTDIITQDKLIAHGREMYIKGKNDQTKLIESVLYR